MAYENPYAAALKTDSVPAFGDDANFETELSDAYNQGLNSVTKKRINLLEESNKKREKLDPRYKKGDSWKYDFQDSLNVGKDIWNTFAPSTSQLDKYDLDDQGKLWLLDDEDKQLERVQRVDDEYGSQRTRSLGADDGDTIAGYRLAGIDTAESLYTDKGKFQRIQDMGISNEDFINAGKMQKEAGKQFLHDNPNITADVGEKDFFGRELAVSDQYNDFMISNGWAVPGSDATDLQWQMYNKAKSEKLGSHAVHSDVMNAMETDVTNYMDSKKYGKEDTFEFIDAFQAAAQTFVGKGAKLIGEATTTGMEDGALETWGKDLMETANVDMGYNPKTMQDASAQMKRGFSNFNLGDIILGAGKAIPQAVAGSVPEMLLYSFGSIPGLAAGVATSALMNSNDALDKREEETGRAASGSEIAAVTGAQTFASLLDAGAFRFITKAGKPLMIKPKGKQAGSFADSIKDLPQGTKTEMAKALGKTLKRGGADAATEAVQESTTEAIRMLTETLDTDKYGDSAIDILTSDEGIERLTDSAVLGGAGGIGFGGLGNTVSTFKDVKNIRDARASKKLRKEATDNVENKATAEEMSVIQGLDYENYEANFEELKKDQTVVEDATNLSEIKDSIFNSSLSDEFKDHLYNVGADLSETELKQEIFRLIDLQMSANVLGGDLSQDLKTGLDSRIVENSFPDPDIQTEDVTLEEAAVKAAQDAQANELMPRVTEFAKGLPEALNDDTRDSVFTKVKDIMDRRPDELTEEYIQEVNEAREAIVNLGSISDDKEQGVIATIDSALGEMIANPSEPLLDAKAEETTESSEPLINDKSTISKKKPSQFVRKKINQVQDIDTASGDTLTKYTASLTDAIGSIDEQIAKLAKNKKNTKTLAGLNQSKIDLQTRIDEVALIKDDAVNKDFDNMIETAKSNRDEGLLISSGSESQEQLNKINKAKRDIQVAKAWEDKQQQNKVLKASKLINEKMSKADDKKITKRNEEISAYDAKLKEIKTIEARRDTFDNAYDKQAANTEIAKLQKDLGTKPVALNKEDMATQRKDKVLKAQDKIKNQFEVVQNEMIDAKERQEAKDIQTAEDVKIAEKYDADPRSKTKLESTRSSAINELKQIQDRMESPKQGDKERFNRLTSDVDSLTKDIDNFDDDSFNRYTEIKSKRTEDKKIKDAEKAKQDKEVADKIDASKDIEAGTRAGELVHDIAQAMSNPKSVKVKYDSKGKLDKANKKVKATLLLSMKDVLSKTSTNALSSLQRQEALALMSESTGLTKEDILKEVKDAVARRKTSNAVLTNKSIRDPQGNIRPVEFTTQDPGSEFAQIMTPVNEARKNIHQARNNNEPESQQDIEIVKSAWTQIAELVRNMSRADFARFNKDGKFSSALAEESGIEFDLDAVVKSVGDVKGKTYEYVEQAIKTRIKKDESITEQRKFVSYVARSNTATRDIDIQHANELNEQLYKDGHFTEKQYNVFKDKLVKVRERSQKVIEETNKKQEDMADKSADEIIKGFDESTRKHYNGKKGFLKMQLLALAGPTGNILDSIYIKKVEKTTDKDGKKAFKITAC